MSFLIFHRDDNISYRKQFFSCALIIYSIVCSQFNSSCWVVEVKFLAPLPPPKKQQQQKAQTEYTFGDNTLERWFEDGL